MTPTRDQVPAADTWDLSPLFTDTAQWQAAFEKLQASYPGISAFAGTLAQGPERLREVLEFDKQLDLQIERISQYASRRHW